MHRTIIMALALMGLLFIACDPDDPKPVNEEELITTLKYTLFPVIGGQEVVFSFQDLDGDGSLIPVITEDTLTANTEYRGIIELLNESETPAENIGEEVAEENIEHQLFYISSVPGMTIEYADMDENGDPLGLITQLKTGAAGSGQLSILLRHEPDKSADGVAQGDPTNAGGETDINVVFSVVIE